MILAKKRDQLNLFIYKDILFIEILYTFVMCYLLIYPEIMQFSLIWYEFTFKSALKLVHLSCTIYVVVL